MAPTCDNLSGRRSEESQGKAPSSSPSSSSTSSSKHSISSISSSSGMMSSSSSAASSLHHTLTSAEHLALTDHQPFYGMFSRHDEEDDEADQSSWSRLRLDSPRCGSGTTSMKTPTTSSATASTSSSFSSSHKDDCPRSRGTTSIKTSASSSSTTKSSTTTPSSSSSSLHAEDSLNNSPRSRGGSTFRSSIPEASETFHRAMRQLGNVGAGPETLTADLSSSASSSAVAGVGARPKRDIKGKQTSEGKSPSSSSSSSKWVKKSASFSTTGAHSSSSSSSSSSHPSTSSDGPSSSSSSSSSSGCEARRRMSVPCLQKHVQWADEAGVADLVSVRLIRPRLAKSEPRGDIAPACSCRSILRRLTGRP